jgi:enoyl-CoA hydratase
MSNTYETILYQPGAVARVILNRPEARNAQSRLMLRELHDALMAASADPDVRVIVVSGVGRDFSAGHDVKEMRGDRAMGGEATYEDVWGRYERLRTTYAEDHLAWRNIPKPTIAMVQGYCIFGGWMVASAMDFIFASEEALFLALPYPADYWSVTWELGPRKTKEVLYEHRFMTAPEALEAGLVNRVYPLADLERETLAYAERVAENDPFQLRDLKLFVNQTMDGMGFTQSVLAAFHSGAVRSRPAGWRTYGQIGPRGLDTDTSVNPFARLVARAVAKLPLIGRKPFD